MKHIELNDIVEFSVIVPMYNAEKYIASTLDSLLKQQFKDFEIIVVDDGSTDKSGEIVTKYFSFDRRIKYVKQENQGTGGALNTGHRLAVGKYLTWCSADNIYLPNFLSGFYSAFQHIEQDKIPVEFLYGDFIYINDRGQKIGEVLHPQPQPKHDLVNGYDCGIAFAYTRNLWEKTGEYSRMICEDFEWVVRAACHTNLGLIKEVMAAFRVHGGQITGSRKEQEKAAADHCKALAAKFLQEGKYAS